MSMKESVGVFCFLLGSSVLKHLGLRVLRALWLRQKVYVGQLTRVVVYPVKSFKGIDVPDARCEYTGLVFETGNDDVRDRVRMVTTDNYTFVTARQKPKMLTIAPSLHGNWIHLEAPGMETLRIPVLMDCTGKKAINTEVWGGKLECVDCGDEASQWICDYLKTPGLRLVYNGENNEKRHLDAEPSHWCRDAKSVDQVAFQDGFPFLLMTDTSVADLNEKLKNKVSMDNYRPNLVITSTCQPYNEDHWSEISIGDATFYNIKPCDRCLLTTIDPETGVRDSTMESIKALRSYRLLYPEFEQSPCLGINLVLSKPGTVHVGDAVYATRTS